MSDSSNPVSQPEWGEPESQPPPAVVVSISAARRRHTPETPLSDEELRGLRRLIALLPELETLHSEAAILAHRCPTYRRVRDELEKD